MALWGRAMMAILVLLSVDIAMASLYVVGGKAGWNLQFSNDVYDTQFANIKLFVGDTLMFPYRAPEHNVYEVAPSAIASCDFSNPIEIWNNSIPVIRLKSSGVHAFGCEVLTHCSSYGMSLTVTVLEKPNSAPVSSPLQAPAPSPPTPSQAAASAPAPVSSPLQAPAPSPATPTQAPASAPAPASSPLEAPSPTSSPPAPSPSTPTQSPASPRTSSPISPPLPPPPSLTPPISLVPAPVPSAVISNGGGIKATTIAGVVVGGVAAVGLLAIFLVCQARNRGNGNLEVSCFGWFSSYKRAFREEQLWIPLADFT